MGFALCRDMKMGVTIVGERRAPERTTNALCERQSARQVRQESPVATENSLLR